MLQRQEQSMSANESDHSPRVVTATGEVPQFSVGDAVLVLDRKPVGHYRVPTYLRGKLARVEAVIRPAGIDNEEEGFGRNAGGRRHYYRVALSMEQLWPAYAGGSRDSLHIEVFETWLERM
jgi:nitrile hydratase